MKTYIAIAVLSLLGMTLSATPSGAVEPPAQGLETATAQYMLSAQTQQRGERPPFRRSSRRNLTEPNVYTHPLQNF
jgi:hypothetical protein